ncbi:MAG: hypothetical protein ACOX6K_05630 [Sphaerochaetaceae bacterium]|jgi:hypothetical protein
MKTSIQRFLIVFVLILALISLGLGIFLFVTRSRGAAELSLIEGPLDMVDLIEGDYAVPEKLSVFTPPEDAEDESEPGTLISDGDFSAGILTDGRTGVGMDIGDDLDWDVSFTANPWGDEYGFTTQWTIHL